MTLTKREVYLLATFAIAVAYVYYFKSPFRSWIQKNKELVAWMPDPTKDLLKRVYEYDTRPISLQDAPFVMKRVLSSASDA